MQTRSRLLLTFLLFLMGSGITTGAVAAEPSYRFADLGVYHLDPDISSSDDGGYLGGSFGIKHFHFFGEYANLDRTLWEAGAGWHGLFGKKADLIFQVSWFDVGVENGLKLKGGARWMVLEKLEINGYLVYTDLDLSSTNGVDVGAVWLFARWFGLGGNYQWGDEANTARLFARFSFGGGSKKQ
jgi:hypothetical protein